VIIECSKCQARFLVPDRAIGGDGRHVRCGRCTHSWFQEPAPETDKAPLPDLNTMIEEINARPRVKPIPKGSNLPVAGLPPIPLMHKLTLGGLALATLCAALLWLSPGVFGYPPSKGLVLADVGVVRIVDKDKHLTFQINGKIANTTSKSMNLPVLRVTLVDSEGNSLQFWDFSGEMAAIEPHKDVPFATGELDIRISKGTRFVAELGSPLELALRRKPQP